MPAKRQGETYAEGVQNPFNARNSINVASSYQVFAIRPTLLVFVLCISVDDAFFCFCTIYLGWFLSLRQVVQQEIPSSQGNAIDF